MPLKLKLLLYKISKLRLLLARLTLWLNEDTKDLVIWVAGGKNVDPNVLWDTDKRYWFVDCKVLLSKEFAYEHAEKILKARFT